MTAFLYGWVAKCQTPADLPYANQENKNWQLIERKSVVYAEDKIIPAPFQYNLFALPENIRKNCIINKETVWNQPVPEGYPKTQIGNVIES